MGLSSEEAAQLLERAFGWRTQAFWRGMKKKEIPDPSQIAASLSFLSKELGESPWQLHGCRTGMSRGRFCWRHHTADCLCSGRHK